MTSENDARIAMLERGASLTPIQRDLLPAQLKELDETLVALRRSPLTDGGGEPCTLFVASDSVSGSL